MTQPEMELLTRQQVADELQLTVNTLAKWAMDGTGPRMVRMGRLVRYRRSDLAEWIDEQVSD